MNDKDEAALDIEGELALQTPAMPRDTNANGDIFGGWLVSQMDLATVSCFCRVTKTGRTSVHIAVDVWTSHRLTYQDRVKVAEGLFVFVAIDDNGNPRPIP